MVWDYTPREFFAWLEISSMNRQEERAETLDLQLAAAQGDFKQVQRMIKRWRKEPVGGPD